VVTCKWTAALEDIEAFVAYLNSKVHFHNTMVDRITAARPSDINVPRAEPLPTKALVIEDLTKVLDYTKFSKCDGVTIRHNPGEIQNDHMLKLCIANGIHTSMVYVMALSRMKNTRECVGCPILMEYLNKLFEYDILSGLNARGIKEVNRIYYTMLCYSFKFRLLLLCRNYRAEYLMNG